MENLHEGIHWLRRKTPLESSSRLLRRKGRPHGAYLLVNQLLNNSRQHSVFSSSTKPAENTEKCNLLGKSVSGTIESDELIRLAISI